MLRELTEIYLNNVNLTSRMMHQLWTETLSSPFFLKSMHQFQNTFFEQREKNDRQMEEWLEVSRIASKNDVNDLVDAQRLVIDLLEDITERIEALEQRSPSAARSDSTPRSNSSPKQPPTRTRTRKSP